MTENTSNSTNEFALVRIYVKDLSFEAPSAPLIFQTEWKPEMELRLDSKYQQVPNNEGTYEVVISISVTAKLKEQVAFIVEAQEAGIFTLKGFSEAQMEELLNVACPNILFPYLRAVVSATVSNGTFPPIYLAPIDFRLLHEERKKQATKS